MFEGKTEIILTVPTGFERDFLRSRAGQVRRRVPAPTSTTALRIGTVVGLRCIEAFGVSMPPSVTKGGNFKRSLAGRFTPG
ncbi:MAG: hypothetical protein NVS4B3_18410 [Gemmatimonadaceae bacterium]